MISFTKLEGPYGIPVYFQRMPEMVKSVSMSWTMFVGGADDESAGEPGLYHWFEHVPFRGTRKFPKGLDDIKALFTKRGGSINAFTSRHSTTYHATAPIGIWKEALYRITDLMAQPLLSQEGIKAEKEIILQEIAGRKARSSGYVYYELPGILWPGHPFGHHVLGSEKSLGLMDEDALRKAYRANYDRSRTVFFAVGNISQDELLSELSNICKDMPSSGLSERRSPTSYGPLPKWRNGATTVRETSFASSTVMVLFPFPKEGTFLENFKKYSDLADAYSFGSTDSPLMKVLREERKLVYGAQFIEQYAPDGGYFGFAAETQTKNVDAVIKAMFDLLKDPRVYAPKRIEDIKTGIKGNMDIRPVDSSIYRSTGLGRLFVSGLVFSDEYALEWTDELDSDRIKETVNSIDPSTAHTIIFKGKE